MEEQFLLVELRRGNKNAFSNLFMAYYKDLVMFAGSYLGERNISEDVVQSVFLKVWNDRESLIIETSFKSYLLASVRNSCLDEIRHRYVVREHESIILSHLELDDIDTENYILYSDLYDHLREALDKLPIACREAFEMSRFEQLKYKEIAVKLNVSERTVEVRVGKALGLLRHYLRDFLSALITTFP